MSAPLISLIMTVRDGARYIAQALESVRAQTFADWELVLWDDGSTDDTLAIVRSFVDERIRVFAGERVGRRQALVEAHARARGTYLAWLDADDWLAPEALAKAHAALVASGCDMIYTDHIVVDGDGERGLGRRARIPYSAHRLLLDFMTFHLRLFTREIFERAGGISPDREIAIDYDLCLRISEHGRVKHFGEPLYYYRQHAEQMSSRRRAEQVAASAAAIRAALVRRGLPFELAVDEARGRFKLVPPEPTPRRASWLRIAAATVLPRLRPPVHAPSVIGHWPSAGDSVYRRQLYNAIQARGVQARALGADLARLVRAVWTGRAGDELHIHSIAPLLVGNEGAVLAACVVFLKTLDHARARGMRVVWISSGPLPPHPPWLVRELAARCNTIVTHWEDDLGSVARFVPYPNLGDAYPHVTRDFALSALGLAPRTSPTHLYLGSAEQLRDGDLALPGDVDAYPPRHVAAYFAAADLAVLPHPTASSLALAMAMAKPIVAPAIGNYDSIDAALAARREWDRVGQANKERVRGHRWETTLEAIRSS